MSQLDFDQQTSFTEGSKSIQYVQRMTNKL